MIKEPITFEEHVEECFWDDAKDKLADAGILDRKEQIALATMRLLEDYDCPECMKAWRLWEELGMDYLHALAITEQWDKFHEWQKPFYLEYKERFGGES